VPIGIDAETRAADWVAGTVKCALFKSTLLPVLDRDAHRKYGDLPGGHEASGTGYTAGGKTVTGKTRTVSYTGGAAPPDTRAYKVVYGCDDVVWTGITVSDVLYSIFYWTDTGQIAAYLQGESPVGVVGGTFRVTAPSGRVLELRYDS